MIVNIEPSKNKNQRFEVTLDDGRKFNFGLKDGQTYIDHHENYLKRHLANKIENKLINDLIPSPALFSVFFIMGTIYELRREHKTIKLFNES